MTGSSPSTPTDHLLYSDDEDYLRSGVRTLLAERSPHNTVLERIESGQPYDPELWKALATEIGVAGLAVPERIGGAGASWRELAVAAEELGRSLAPTPFLGSAVLATAALLSCADESVDANDLLECFATQGDVGALAVPLTTPPSAALRTEVRADTVHRLHGSVTTVSDALFADILLVPATTPTGQALYAVATTAAGVSRTPVVTFDLTRQLADLTLDGVPALLLASGDAAAQAVRAAVTAGAAVLASEQLGIAEYCLASTVAYVKQRYQFGRAVGSFQAPKHRLADLWVGVTQGRAVARYAAACLAANDTDSAVATAIAQSYCSELAVRAAEDSMQLHGGIGFTWEHPVHLYLKRAKADALAFGRPDQHRAALAPLVDLPAT
ncbi:acyl-CoA dehydrogenase family protein [Flindersiella endophytica]